MTANYRMYVACLAAYNNGVLHGEWIDLDGKDADDIQAEIDAILAASPVPCAEEWAVHDWDGPGLDRFGEHPNLDAVADYVETMESLDDSEQDAFIAFIDNIGAHDDTALERFRDVYIGEYDNVEHYAQEFLDDTGALSGVPESLRYYFDTAAYARDLESSGDIWTAPAPNGGVFVFDDR